MVRVFSGIRPSGKLHLGNYLGAIKNWIELQNKADPAQSSSADHQQKGRALNGASQAIFAVVDYHGITTPFDPQKYHEQVMDVVLDYLAAGVDPNKALLIRQSKVPQHTELGWIFNTIIPVSWLDRLPTYREKLEQVKQNSGIEDLIREESMTEKWVDQKGYWHKSKRGSRHYVDRAKYYQNTMGLLDYPVLMAADILIYKSNLVPVGEDQMPHIDLTNEIGRKFNSMFGNTFPAVKAQLTEGARIMSLQDPTKKMSKTGDEGIALSDSPDEIRKKIKKAVTDSGKEVVFNPDKKPAISNLITIYHLLSQHQANPLTAIKKGGGLDAGQAGKSIQEIEAMYQGKSYADFKSDLGEVVVSFLEPFQVKYNELKKNPDFVMSILTKSEERAKVLASSTLKEVKEKMGLE